MNNTLTVDEVKQMINSNELCPLEEIDKDGNIGYTDKWFFQDNPNELYRIRKANDNGSEFTIVPVKISSNF